jgi:hypothetical protein
MAAPQYSTTQLIENIKRRCAVPTSQLTYENSDFTALANDELQGEVVPLLMSTREEYFVTYVDVSTNGNVVTIPEDAVGEKLRSVAFVQQSSPLVLINLPRIDLDVVAGIGFSNYASLAGFYVQGNELILYPSNSVPANTLIRLYYYKRTLSLTAPSTFGQVTSIDPDTNTIVLSFVPYDWDVGTVLNSVSSRPPFGTTNSEVTIVADSSPSLVVDSVEGIEVGDYMSEQGYSAVPQIPIEAHAYLAQLTAVKCLEGLGDRSGMEAAQAKADMLKKSMLVMVSQRVDGSVKKVVNPNGGLRITGGLWRRGYGRF